MLVMLSSRNGLQGVLCCEQVPQSHTSQPQAAAGPLAFILLACLWDQGRKSLTEVPETRARASRDAGLPVSCLGVASLSPAGSSLKLQLLRKN